MQPYHRRAQLLSHLRKGDIGNVQQRHIGVATGDELADEQRRTTSDVDHRSVKLDPSDAINSRDTCGVGSYQLTFVVPRSS